ncbi:DUF1206 domain-containing protein [Pseudooceanicola sp. HF7]|uniref:DUF1206 domain-containing protein n=1 Tax=Pseudooceanicola sp. HF7 TaxID=2721560 RepID=UPI0014322900|nr:DUF1206 domain-containing protein [Pseudooceanicola sp. HF7]NIZ11016.1 DUF1206 domain-containing protein [Pseudooceanicola sp. HF7]
MSQSRAPAWVVPMMRFGYSARGFTYVLLGGLVLSAAMTGGQAESTQSALATLRGQPFGPALLWLLAIGFLAYSAWRFICAGMDLERRGTDAKGIIARIGQSVSGLVYGGLAVTSARLAMGAGGSGGGGNGTRTLASWLLEQPMGKWLVVAAGLITIGAGAYYGVKAWKESYKEHMAATPTSQKLDPVIKGGLVAHGIVIAIIGGFLAYAGWTSDPSDAGGMTQAFEAVRAQPYGQVLLAALAVGLVGFAVYCFVEARYRIVPARAGDDVTTLAAQARNKVEQEGRKAASHVS